MSRLTIGGLAVCLSLSSSARPQSPVLENVYFRSAPLFTIAGNSHPTMDFESVPEGTVFGGVAGYVPGDVVLIQDGINMSVEVFVLGSFTGFLEAAVGANQGLPTQSLALNNISVQFEFADVECDVSGVTLQFGKFGGTCNFAVNGEIPIELPVLSDLPPDVAPGVTASVQDGVITLVGNIDRFLIGGQELVIDNIIASCSGVQSCGDGVLGAGEECDDGDTDDGDGCSATCTVEPGWDCTGDPSVCITVIPTLSEWGLVTLALLGLTAGTFVFTNKRWEPLLS